MPDVFVAKKAEEEESPDNQDTKSPKATNSTSRITLSPPNGENRNHMQPTTAYSEFPSNIEFENQEPGEVIYLFLRAHVITNFGWVAISTLLVLLPFLFFSFVLPVIEQAGITVPPNFQIVLVLFYYLIIFGYAFVSYVSWFFNIGIVTNLRVVDIDVNDITSKSVAATEMKDILDVEYGQKGFLQNFFDYGDIHIQLAGMKPNFEFFSVPFPAKTSDVISDLMREAKGE